MSEHKQLVAGVEVAGGGRVKGVWASEGKQTIGIVEEDGVGPYLVIYQDTAAGNLPLAVTADGVQLPRTNPSDPHRFIEWNTLFAMVEEFKARSFRSHS